MRAGAAAAAVVRRDPQPRHAAAAGRRRLHHGGVGEHGGEDVRQIVRREHRLYEEVVRVADDDALGAPRAGAAVAGQPA